MPSSQLPFSPYLIAVPVALLFLFLRLQRMRQERRLRIEWLWVTPALFIAITAMALLPAPPTGTDWIWMAAALAVGGAAGWYRGKMMRISVDPQTHALNMRASAAAIYFFVVILLARYGLRYLAFGQAQTWHLSVTLITDLFLAFAVGLLGVQRIEMFLRAQRLLGEARAAKAVQQTS